uniref:Uncharacterized protein n=2 Tax=Setaria italica TaxID=4555 RepID=K3YXU8_SETIT
MCGGVEYRVGWNRARVRVRAPRPPRAAPPPPPARPTCRAGSPHASRREAPGCPRGRDRDPRTGATSRGSPPLAVAAPAFSLVLMASRAAVLLVAVAAVLFAAASAQEMDLGVPPAPAPVTGAAAGAAASALAVACSAVLSIVVAGGLMQ